MDTNKVGDYLIGLLSKKRFDRFDVYVISSVSLSVEMKEGVLDCLDSSNGVGLAVRTIASGRLGFAYGTSYDKDALRELVDHAAEGMVHTSEDKYLGFPASSGEIPALPGLYDDRINCLSQDERIERARALEAAALTADSRVKKVRKASYSESRYQVLVANSSGIRYEHSGTLFSVAVMALASDGDDSQMGWDFGFSRNYEGLEVEGVGKTAAANAARLLHARRIKTRKVPVLLENRVAADFVEVLASSFQADRVQKGKSRLQGKLGEQLFSPLVNLVDDGLYPGGLASAPVDGEGVARQTNQVVQSGRLKMFLYDSYCANKDGVSLTGNGVRGDFKSPPRVGLTNFYLEEGETEFNKLLSQAKEGVWITDVLGMHMVDPTSLDFSIGCSGLLITGGEVAYPVKGLAISGNLLNVFSEVQQVGNDLRFFGSVGSPSLLIAPITLSGE